MSTHHHDLVVLILQALHSLGFTQTTACLQSESSITPNLSLQHLHQSLLLGYFSEALSLLKSVHGLSPTSLQRCRYLISKQKFIELLQKQHHFQALDVLRFELTFSASKDQQLHKLSSQLWMKEAKGRSRSRTARKVEEEVRRSVGSVVTQPDRLERLVKQGGCK